MMSVRTAGFSKVSIALVVLSLALVGCAQNAVQVKADAAVSSQLAVIQAVKVSGDDGQQVVEVESSQPVTYTSYKSSDPAKIVLDIAQAELKQAVVPLEINSSQIKQVQVTEHALSGGKLCRVEVTLAKDADYAVAPDAANGNKLLIRLLAGKDAPAASDTGAAKAEPVAAVPAAPAPAEVAPAAEKPLPVVTAKEVVSPLPADGARVLKTITDTKDGITVVISGTVTDYKSFRLNKPDRLVLDIPGAKSEISSKTIALGGTYVTSARVGIYADKVRIVFDSAHGELPESRITATDSGLLIAFSAEAPKEAAPHAVVPAPPSVPAPAPAAPAAAKETVPVPAPAPAAPVAPAPVASEPADNALDAIDFKVVDGVSRIILNVGKNCVVGTPAKGDGGIVLAIKNCRLPKSLQRPLDTRAFASPVKSVTPYQVRVKGSTDVRIAVALKRDMPFVLKRDGGAVHLDVTNPPDAESAALAAPAVKSAKAKEFVDRPAPEPVQVREPAREPVMAAAADNGKKIYTGRRVTLEFADADVRKIFQLIAEVSNLNFLIGDDVTGTMSLKLVNVPWDQALDVILETRGLGMQRDGNIVQIKPKNKIQSQVEEEQKVKDAVEASMPLVTEVFDVNFASVSDVATQFKNFISARGKIIEDKRTNRVIVTDVGQRLGDMRNLLRTLDIPEKQVVIEARIVEASSDFTRELGIQWGLHEKNRSGNNSVIADIGFGGGVNRSAGTAGTFGPGLAAGFTFGQLINNATLDMKLEAFALIGQIKVVSTPKVLTLNNKEAKITQGTEVPYTTVSAEGTKVEFKAAELTLEVTPHITSDGSITMKIKAKNDSVGTAFASGPPSINTKQATTEMLVKNGETTVIGGIFLDRESDADNGVPFLMDIPLIGGLFKSNQKQKNRSELLIFITPKIVM